MTGYELQQFIKKIWLLICSHSAGSVQTALSKLEKEGKVTASEIMTGKRRKKKFSSQTPAQRLFRLGIPTHASGKSKEYGVGGCFSPDLPGRKNALRQSGTTSGK